MMDRVLGRIGTAICVLRGHHVTKMVLPDKRFDLYFLSGYRCLQCRCTRAV